MNRARTPCEQRFSRSGRRGASFTFAWDNSPYGEPEEGQAAQEVRRARGEARRGSKATKATKAAETVETVETVEDEGGGTSKPVSTSTVKAGDGGKAKPKSKPKSKSKAEPGSEDKDEDAADDKGKGKDKSASKAEAKSGSKARAKAVSKAAAEAEDKTRAAVRGRGRRGAGRGALAASGDQELAPAQAKQLVEEVAARIIADAEATAERAQNAADLTELLRLTPGAPVDLSAIDPRSTPGVVSRAKAEAQFTALADRVGELQERLYAAAAGAGSQRRVLLVLQGMDTSGKGGTVRHCRGAARPQRHPGQGLQGTDGRGARTRLPVAGAGGPAEAGQIGIFDRSHYEDVLVAKVRKLAPPMQIGRRYGTINRFEKSLADEGCVVVKCFLHISPEQQRERLLARLDDPDKRWKFNPRDVDDRLLWPDFQEAYRVALERCGTEDAPWHVIPADRKWYRNYAVLRLLIEALEGIDPHYPPGEFDLEAERARVLAS